jgi:hypothetical protein
MMQVAEAWVEVGVEELLQAGVVAEVSNTIRLLHEFLKAHFVCFNNQ